MTAELDHLTARLARAADDAGLLDVAFTTVDTPVGPLLLAATDQGSTSPAGAPPSTCRWTCGCRPGSAATS